MVALALAVVSILAVACVVFVVFRRAFPPAFCSPDELARWATRLNATGVQLTWWGGLRGVTIEPRIEVPADGAEPAADETEEEAEVNSAFDVFRKSKSQRQANRKAVA